jgi:hypothetical protein
MNLRPSLHSRIYRDFVALSPGDYHRVIRFFEDQEDAIRNLDFAEYFELLITYTDALFEVGAYRQHLAVVDEAIEASINDLVMQDQGRPVFRRMLFRKAASLYHGYAFAEAEYIICELIRIEPEDEDAIRFLRRTRRRQQGHLTRHSRAAAILLFGLSALVIGIEVLLIRPFFSLQTETVEWTRNLIFLAGWLVLLAGEGWSFFKAYQHSQQFLQELP